MSDRVAVNGDMPAETSRAYAAGLALAAAGALLFAFPLMMTMEMWWFGFTLDRDRLALFTLVTLLLLMALAWFTGFERSNGLADAVLDGLTAYGIGALVSALMLWLFGIIGPGLQAGEIAGKVAVQAIPAGIGAAIARKQFGSDEGEDEETKEQRSGYGAQLFLMTAGALLIAFNVAPTEEMLLIALQVGTVQLVLLMLLSLLLLDAIVYSVGFSGQEGRPGNRTLVASLLSYTVAGYAVALAVSLYVLWTFGRLDGAGTGHAVAMTVVLGLPTSIGAAVARLIV